MKSLALLVALIIAGLMVGLSACTPTVHMEPASAATDSACAEVIVRLPKSLGAEKRVWTNAQATAAWGTPTSVLLTCGLEPPAPTTQQCVSLGGVDWIVDESDSPNLRLTTYGREPAAQAYVDTTVLSADAVLQSLAMAVQQLPKYSECIAPATDSPETTEGLTAESAP